MEAAAAAAAKSLQSCLTLCEATDTNSGSVKDVNQKLQELDCGRGDVLSAQHGFQAHFLVWGDGGTSNICRLQGKSAEGGQDTFSLCI